jgi:hypothetical protein
VFDTQVGTNNAVPAKSQWLTLINSKLTVGQDTVDAGSALATVPAQSLFPFLDGYKIYAGRCAENNPTTSPNTGAMSTYSPTPGQILTMTTANDIRLPSINLRVINNTTTGAGVNGASVFIYPLDTTVCNNRWPTAQVTVAKQYTTSTGGTITYQGALPEPGFPYGKYRLCAQAGGKRGFADVFPYTTVTTVNEPVTNSKPAGNDPTYNASPDSIRIFLGTTGSCPAP